MRKWIFTALVAAIAMAFNLSITRADDSVIVADHGAVLGGIDAGLMDSCDAGGGLGGGWGFEIETTWLRYHRNDNLQTDNIFGFEFAPRVTLSHQDCDGLGFRLRWWDYDHTGVGTINGTANRQLGVDTYNIDLEIYQNVQITCCTSVEISGGIRYNDFQEEIRNAGGALVQADTFSAYGAIFGLKARRQMGLGTAYVRWNTAILMDDHNAIGGHGLEFDQVLTQTELGIGFEYTSCLSNGAILTIRSGIEYSHWTDYVHDAADADDNTNVGFGGFVFAVGVNF